MKITKKIADYLSVENPGHSFQGQQPRLYVSFPLALAAAIGLGPGESVQWELLDRGELHLLRSEVSPPSTRRRALKK